MESEIVKTKQLRKDIDDVLQRVYVAPTADGLKL